MTKQKKSDELTVEAPKIFSRFEKSDYLFAALVIILFIFNYMFIAPLQQLASPIYGGDLYSQAGIVEHIKQGGSVFENGQMKDMTPWAPWFYHWTVAQFSKLTGMDVLKSINYFSLIILVISSIIIYRFSNRIFSNKILSLVPVLIAGLSFPVFKYTDFAAITIMTGFFYAMYNFMNHPSWKNTMIAGVMFGLAGISNTHSFIASVLFLGVYYLMFYLMPLLRSEKKLDDLKNQRYFASLFGIGFLISLLFWYWPIFVYHAKTLNPVQDFGFADYHNFSNMLHFAWASLTAYFLYWKEGLTRLLLTVGTSFGVFIAFFSTPTLRIRFLRVMFISGIIGMLHYFITIPLLGTHFVADRIAYMILFTGSLLFIALAVNYISNKFDSKYKTAFIFAVLLLLVLAVSMKMSAKNADQWTQVGKQPLAPYFADIKSWIDSNTYVDDVFITNNEDAFMMNALTGRKVLAYRRAHSSAYIDYDQRLSDAAVILYGNNTKLRKDLIDKYDVKYLLWTARWFDNEFNVDDKGKLVNLFDPYMVLDTPERRDYLSSNGVKFQQIHTFIDPAIRGDFAPTYDVLLILPAEGNLTHPWHKSLDASLKPTKDVVVNNQLFARIYRVG